MFTGTIVTDKPLARADADGVLQRFLAGFGLGGKIRVNLVESFAALPDKIRTAAEKGGGNEDNS